MAELDDELYSRIRALCDEGEELIEEEDFAPAAQRYAKALELLPAPVEQWEAATWILSGLADAHYHAGEFPQARNALAYVMRCPGAVGNPYLHLRLGEVHFELGDTDRARDELARALMSEGREIFEHEDPKYFEFITRHMKPPAGQESW